MMYKIELPESNLNIASLSRLFDDTTNSYKYIFFISILDLLKRRSFDVSNEFTFKDLIVEMLANAWFPHAYFKLSFGLQDQIVNKLNSLNLEVPNSVLSFTDIDKKQLRDTISKHKIDNSLMRYVPYRLIVPFFDQTAKPRKDGDINKWVKDKASQAYKVSEAPYFIENDSIRFSPAWAEYFKDHYTIIRGWASWEWLNYMQRCNPNVPAVSNKLFPPQQRTALNEQKKYWRVVLENVPIYCIFSKQRISQATSPLDHFLPWSFVAHDQLWNLLPILSNVNSSKSNNLPSAKYYNNFISLQHLGLVVSRQYLIESEWNKYTESYLLDLKITNRGDLLNREVLINAYQPILASLTELAKGQGFCSGWVYSNSV